MKHIQRLIQLDVNRTKVKDITPKQKESMYRILFSYGKRNMKIGYCQGMNSIVYFLLEKGFNEERVFWMLVYILETLVPQGYYTNMGAIISDISLFKHMLSVIKPGLVLHIRQQMIDLNYFLIPWFVMLFTGIDNDEVM